MKANELMLGDWVYGLYPNGDRYHRPFRISAVDTYPNNRSPRIVTEGGYGFQEEHLEPIPLTPEILEKNGFGEYEYNEVYDDEIEVEVSLYEWPIDEGSCPGFSTNLHYVHELQHALRLCGIDKEIVV